MSLLMDALRKAETDKKDAARATGAPAVPAAPPPETRELRLEPYADASVEDLRGQGLTDETLADGAVGTTQAFAAGRTPAPAAATPPAVFFDEPPATPPSTGARRSRAPGSLAHPSLVTAQTVFEAGAQSPAQRLLVGIIALTVLLAVALTGIGIYYYQRTPLPRPLPSPRVAVAVEKPERQVPFTPVPIMIDAVPALPEAAASPSATAVSPAPAVAVAAPPAAANGTEMGPLAGAAETAATPATPAATPPAQRLPDTIPRDAEIAAGEVRIARSKGRDDPTAKLNQAYAAFLAGQSAVAEKTYEEVLARHPEQQDALLGLAAIAMRGNRLADAHRLYTQVLARHPAHPVATAALFMIEGGAGEAVTPARLKLLLDNGVDSPYLQFALGNLYAGQRRWADAQQAYFAAFGGAPGNADYAYNLAVSLDHLGQRAPALSYYRRALSLADGGTAVFNPARVAARIAALEAAPGE